MQLQVPTLQWEARKPPRILGNRGKDSATVFAWGDASQWRLPQHSFFLTQLWKCTWCSLAIANHFPSILLHCPHICYIGATPGKKVHIFPQRNKREKRAPIFLFERQEANVLLSQPLTVPNHPRGQELSSPMAATPVAASNYRCKKKQKCMTGLWLSKSLPRQKQAINCSVVLILESRQTSILYTAACITVIFASGCMIQEPTIPLVLNKYSLSWPPFNCNWWLQKSRAC